jgi:hypothetical protein
LYCFVQDDDDDDSADDLDETALEGFTTPIDDEDNPETVDEYIAFQEVMNSEFTSRFLVEIQQN